MGGQERKVCSVAGNGEGTEKRVPDDEREIDRQARQRRQEGRDKREKIKEQMYEAASLANITQGGQQMRRKKGFRDDETGGGL